MERVRVSEIGHGGIDGGEYECFNRMNRREKELRRGRRFGWSRGGLDGAKMVFIDHSRLYGRSFQLNGNGSFQLHLSRPR